MKNIDLDAAKVYWKCKGRLPAKIGSCPKSVNCCIECSDNAALVGMAFYQAWNDVPETFSGCRPSECLSARKECKKCERSKSNIAARYGLVEEVEDK